MSYCPIDEQSENDEDDHASAKTDKDTSRWNKSWVRTLLLFLNGSTDEWAQRRLKRLLQLLGSTTACLVIAYWYRKRRRLDFRQLDKFSFLSRFLTRKAYSHALDTPLSTLYHAIKSGGITKAVALTSKSAIAYEIAGNWKRSSIPSTQLHSSIVEQLASSGTDVCSEPDSILSKLSTPLTLFIPFIYLGMLYKMMKHLNGENDEAKTHVNVKVAATFRSVAGLDHVLSDLSEIVLYLRDPRIYNSLGARPPNGVLLYGPPGTGKTLLARAVAGEVGNCDFIACSGSDFVDMYVGRGASRVRKLFSKARQSQRCILFIDELDALGKSRSTTSFSGNNDERDQTLNQLLTELDGFNQHPKHLLIFMGATNRAELLDPALLRRMDRQIHVGLPDQVGRRAILLVHAKKVQCDAAIDWNYLATQTTDFSGANIATVVNEAALLAVRERSPTVKQHHLIRSISKLQMMKRALSGMSGSIHLRY